jgi:hypothetical protein
MDHQEWNQISPQSFEDMYLKKDQDDGGRDKQSIGPIKFEVELRKGRKSM